MKFFRFLYNIIKIKIPLGLKKDFDNELLRKNYGKLSLTSVVLFILELIVYVMPQRLFEYKTIVLHILIINIVLIPVIFLIKINFDKVNKLLALIVQDVYLYTILILAMFMALKSQGAVDFVHMYLMAVMSIASFIYIKYLNALLLFGSVFALFMFLLPYYQTNRDIVFLIITNSLVFIVLSFIMIYIRIKSKAASFMDKRQLEKLAQSDSMTEFFNHKTAMLKLSAEIEKSKFSGNKLCLLMIDIDDFKRINDQYGHIQGDEIIKDVAGVIRQQTRVRDIIGRYGGDEFIVIMPKTDINDAEMIIDNIFRAISYKKIPVTLSAGINLYGGETLNEFVKNADLKLYKAKNLGKNRYESQ